MRVHTLQHVPFEDLGSMADFFEAKEYDLSTTHLYRGDPLPDTTAYDFLIVMGGPMGVEDTAQYPWLVEEKRCIANAIESGKRVLGICLGAQLIAEVAGARVFPNEYREIGWFPIRRSTSALTSVLGSALPQALTVFHWHGDTFDLPAGATNLASSEACQNQGFVIEDRVVALQFHLETTPRSAAALIKNCSDDIDGSIYTQSSYDILAKLSTIREINVIMRKVLRNLITGSEGCHPARERVL
jgi:GMP synthase-like glutamine amidotransferase